MKNSMVRHFLSIRDLEPEEILRLCGEAAELKAARGRAGGQKGLQGKKIALSFEKPSMRTRVSFEVAAKELGGTVVDLSQMGRALGKGEAIQDVARVLSRYVDALVVRTYGHDVLEQIAHYSSIPVINGLTDAEHPCQVLADLLTIQEKLGRIEGIKLAYIGDGNNVCHSLMLAGARMKMEVGIAAPKKYAPNKLIVSRAATDAQKYGGKVSWTSDPLKAVLGADVVYTDVWASMGYEKELAARKKAFKKYQVNAKLLKHAKPNALVMHCLPAHRGEEITEEVLEGPQSIVFDQAENRLHIQKALLLWLLVTSNQ